MTISGVSMLASKLQHQPFSTMSSASLVRSVDWPTERIKLTDSLATVVKQRSAHLSVDEIREELISLVDQCRSQEESLLYFHTRFQYLESVLESLKSRLAFKMRENQELKIKSVILHAWKRGLKKKTTPTIMESVNLNDTLKNLALALESPTNLVDASICSNISIPFRIARQHRYIRNIGRCLFGDILSTTSYAIVLTCIFVLCISVFGRFECLHCRYYTAIKQQIETQSGEVPLSRFAHSCCLFWRLMVAALLNSNGTYWVDVSSDT